MQFSLSPAAPKPKPPAWVETLGRWVEAALRPIGRFFGWLFSHLPDAAYARIILVTLLVAGAALILYLVVQRARSGEWRWPWHRQPPLPAGEAADLDWQPDAAPVRAWLDEADALAAQGRFAEAIHCLLLRSVDDIARRRPQLARPALTGRELAASVLLPERARVLFSGIASTVERSLFGGRAVDGGEWSEARAAYSAFALASSWSR
ncbi:DUF4129 domain-containing protein [Sphingomonas ginkgonis]|uniref:DUF4129 domain-containing protein n=1 Tax=Sphingomonas ginkgonis TaxID=2315330 RepID=A0A3R9YP37_9SPHN|nr:DUF4129 domain-containing protein [Sphingomonas ginkgonis]